jgi:hypothetical protein
MHTYTYIYECKDTYTYTLSYTHTHILTHIHARRRHGCWPQSGGVAITETAVMVSQAYTRACTQGLPPVVHVLAEARADVNMSDSAAKSCTAIACHAGYAGVAAFGASLTSEERAKR